METPQPYEAEQVKAKEPRKLCGAKTRNGTPCKCYAEPGRERCRLHGGLTPRGPDSVHWKHGNGAKGKARRELPNLAVLYQESLCDPELMRFRHDAALYEALRRQITNRLTLDRPVSAAAQKRLIDLGEAIRRIKESEYRRIQILQQMVPLEQHRRALAATGAIVSEVIQERMALALAAIDAGKEPAAVKALLNGAEWTQDMSRRYRIAALRTPAIMDLSKDSE